jgi:hypothetical protein
MQEQLPTAFIIAGLSREQAQSLAKRIKDVANPVWSAGANLGKVVMWAAAVAAALVLSGCAYYVPTAYPAAAPASFERSFSAASGAMRDQGLSIRTEDPTTGTIVGISGGATVSASVRRQADGSVRVQFDADGPRDPALIDRISRSYDMRMGR